MLQNRFLQNMLGLETLDKYSILLTKLEEKKKLAIAFSGGIDSTLLAYAAKQVGIDTLLITVTSPLFSSYDKKMAIEIAHELGIRHVLIPHDLDPHVSRNEPLRCYHCKKDEAETWKKTAAQQGYSIVADGCNIDDVQDEHRPGVLACNEQGIWHPLAEANITKMEIRDIARIIGIPIWDRPSNACLASRIQFGEEITIQKLQMVETAEDFLRKISPQVRVRLHRNIARIEVPVSHLKDILNMREKIISFMDKIGFVYIALDLGGYRSGSMHEDMTNKDVQSCLLRVLLRL
jgi:uncharacterized protein